MSSPDLPPPLLFQLSLLLPPPVQSLSLQCSLPPHLLPLLPYQQKKCCRQTCPLLLLLRPQTSQVLLLQNSPPCLGLLVYQSFLPFSCLCLTCGFSSSCRGRRRSPSRCCCCCCPSLTRWSWSCSATAAAGGAAGCCCASSPSPPSPASCPSPSCLSPPSCPCRAGTACCGCCACGCCGCGCACARCASSCASSCGGCGCGYGTSSSSCSSCPRPCPRRTRSRSEARRTPSHWPASPGAYPACPCPALGGDPQGRRRPGRRRAAAASPGCPGRSGRRPSPRPAGPGPGPSLSSPLGPPPSGFVAGRAGPAAEEGGGGGLVYFEGVGLKQDSLEQTTSWTFQKVEIFFLLEAGVWPFFFSSKRQPRRYYLQLASMTVKRHPLSFMVMFYSCTI
mmetsp:Transcript_34334/g.56052  ORF Transcript_34334/g.56052 Transcript_34334/m.56052 type:complete len:392 (-) Transcript_34334:741-1916(-)